MRLFWDSGSRYQSKCSLRLGAALLAFIYVITSVSASAPAHAQQSSPAEVVASNSIQIKDTNQAAAPDQLQIKIPQNLGTVEELHQGTNGKTIIYIQDAHDSLEAQENIAKIINHLVAHYEVKTVYEEGYEGPVPTDEYFGFIKDPKVKEKVSYFLMDKLRLGGAEYARINSAYSQELRAESEELRKEEQAAISGKRSANVKEKLETSHQKKADSQELRAESEELRKEEQAAISAKRSALENDFPKRYPLSANRYLANAKHSYDFKLIGVDSRKLHRQNIDYAKRHSKNQDEIEKDLKALSLEIKKLAQTYFPPQFKEWMKLKERYDLGQIPILDYLQRSFRLLPSDKKPELTYPRIKLLLNASPSKDPSTLEQAKRIDPVILLQETERLEKDLAENFLKSERDRKIFDYFHALNLAMRLNKLEITPGEYGIIKAEMTSLNTQQMAEFIAKHSKTTVVLSRKWEDAIQNAFHVYETAKAREAVLENHLAHFMKKPAAEASVLVFGGFHKTSIEKILKDNGFSFAVITPKITAPDKRHQAYYKQLTSAGYHNFERPLLTTHGFRPESVLNLNRSESRAYLHTLAAAIEANRAVPIDVLANHWEKGLPKIPNNVSRSESRPDADASGQPNHSRAGRSEMRIGNSSLTNRLDELNAGQLKNLFLNGYRTGRIKRISQYEAWQKLETDKEKLLVAGTFVLRKITGADGKKHWALLLGRRSAKAKDSKGTFSGPVGKVDKPIDSKYERAAETLKNLGVLSETDYAPQQKRESVPAAAARELVEETGISLKGQFSARINDFRGNHEGILVNFMVYVDETESSEVSGSDELGDFQWVPLNIILENPAEEVGEVVEKFLQQSHSDSDLMHGLKTGGMRNLQQLLREALSKSGEDWEPIDNFSHPNHIVADKSGVLWLLEQHGLFNSKDEGDSWSYVPIQLKNDGSTGWLLSLYYDSNENRLWVTDYGNGTDGGNVLYSDALTESSNVVTLNFLPKPVEPIGGFYSPTSATVDAKGRVWVADYRNRRVLRTDNLGKNWETIRTLKEHSGPTSIKQDSQGWFWLTVDGNPPLMVSKDDGKNWSEAAVYGRGVTGMYNTTMLYEDSRGRLWILDYGNGLLKVSVDRGNHWSSIGDSNQNFETQDKAGQFAYPSSIVETNNYFFVTDPKRNKVHKIGKGYLEELLEKTEENSGKRSESRPDADASGQLNHSRAGSSEMREKDEAAISENTVSRDFIFNNPQGLHLRPIWALRQFAYYLSGRGILLSMRKNGSDKWIPLVHSLESQVPDAGEALVINPLIESVIENGDSIQVQASSSRVDSTVLNNILNLFGDLLGDVNVLETAATVKNFEPHYLRTIDYFLRVAQPSKGLAKDEDSGQVDWEYIASVFPPDDYLAYLVLYLSPNFIVNSGLFEKEPVETQAQIKEAFKSILDQIEEAKKIAYRLKSLVQGKNAGDIKSGYADFAAKVKTITQAIRQSLNAIPLQENTLGKYLPHVEDAEEFVAGIEMLLNHEVSEININDALNAMLAMTFTQYYLRRGYDYLIRKELASHLPLIYARPGEVASLLLHLLMPFQSGVKKRSLSVKTSGEIRSDSQTVLVIRIESEEPIDLARIQTKPSDAATLADEIQAIADTFKGAVKVLDRSGQTHGFEVRLPVIRSEARPDADASGQPNHSRDGRSEAREGSKNTVEVEGYSVITSQDVYPPNSVTTVLFLRGLRPQMNSRVWDLGTGSGIVSVAAADRGAGFVLATDRDLKACLCTSLGDLSKAF